MKRLPWIVLSLMFFVAAVSAQNSNGAMKANNNTSSAKNSNSKRGPVFRATADQIKQAQSILKQRNFYTGEQTGKLDDATREGLKKYQEAESLKVTGTLNRATLEKMRITLTDRQRSM